MDGAEYAKVMQEKLELVAELKEQHASMRSENWRLTELLSSLPEAFICLFLRWVVTLRPVRIGKSIKKGSLFMSRKSKIVHEMIKAVNACH